MRCLSAARALRKKTRTIHEVPRDGSELRRIYDLLQANKGKPVELGDVRPWEIIPLEDFYGLDIRKVGRKSFKTGAPSLHLLAGEWFGRVYIDYVAERMDGEAAQ